MTPRSPAASPKAPALRQGVHPLCYYVTQADFVACHKQSYIHSYDIVHEVKPGGTFLLNTLWKGEELERNLPNHVKRTLARNHVKFYTIDAVSIAQELGLGNRTNTVLQAAFFKLSGIIPIEDAVKYMKDAIIKSYSKKGQKIVDMNNQAVDLGVQATVKVEIPAAWADATDEPVAEPKNMTPFVRDIVMPLDKQQGDKLPVSVFQKYGVLDGTWENGTSVYSKRGVATKVPKWNPEACIQCNRCSMCCPHAAIRPVLLTDEEKAGVPDSFVTAPAKGLGKDAPKYNFRMQLSPYDCLAAACA